MSELHGSDLTVWAEQQAELLRRHAAGDPATGNLIDWPNIIAEIESIGQSEVPTVSSLLRQALSQMLKVRGWPLSPDAPAWQADMIDFRRRAQQLFTPSMRRRIDITEIYADAMHALPETLDDVRPLPLPPVCPVTLSELLMVGLLRPRSTGPQITRPSPSVQTEDGPALEALFRFVARVRDDANPAIRIKIDALRGELGAYFRERDHNQGGNEEAVDLDHLDGHRMLV